jgi:hypothetical protein
MRKLYLLIILSIFICSNLAASNLLQNSSFENGTTTYWTEIGTESSITQSTSQVHSGNYSCRFSNLTSSYAGRGIQSNNIIVTAGNSYDLHGWFYVEYDGSGDLNDTDIRLRVFWLKDDQSTPCDPASNPNSTGWNVGEFDNWISIQFNTIIAPAEAAFAYIVIDCKEDINNNNDVFIDDIQFGIENTLPVNLSSFYAVYAGGTPTLYWTTQSEENNDYWNVYRGTNENYETAAQINAEHVPGNGTTNYASDYIYIDTEPVAQNSTYWYWIEDVSTDGETVVHEPITLDVPFEDTPNTYEFYGLHQNYPNPFNPSTSISFNLDEDSNVELIIYNVKGEKIKSIFNDHVYADQINSVIWDGNDANAKQVSSGVYFYKLITDTKEYQRKMLLVK